MFKLLISKRASNALKKLPPEHQDAIVAAFEEIIEDPYLGKPLGRELSMQFSFRVGNYRIIYKIRVQDKQILVFKVGPRPRVYS